MRTIALPFLLFFLFKISYSQTHSALLSMAHSHNDYEQQRPFHHAYEQQFGSIEADIWLENGNLLVGHDHRDLSPDKSLKALYLDPLLEQFRKNGGRVYKDSRLRMQLLIDIKSEAHATLEKLVTLLDHYNELTSHPDFRISISGNRPIPAKMMSYPSYIYFDGRPYEKYTNEVLPKIGLISDSYDAYYQRKTGNNVKTPDLEKIRAAIQYSHSLGKPFRFWGTPDDAITWELMLEEGADFINTDKIDSLSVFLYSRSFFKEAELSGSLKENSMDPMPYNRKAKSSGQVLRFGDPSLENHSLDIAILPNKKTSVILDRYGIAVVDLQKKRIIQRFSYPSDPAYKKLMSVYSGIRIFQQNGRSNIAWSASSADGSQSGIFLANWSDSLGTPHFIPIKPSGKSKKALPNELCILEEKGKNFAYIVLNGSNSLIKMDLETEQIIWTTPTGNAPYGICAAGGFLYVTNWAGPLASDSSREIAGTPNDPAYTDPTTGATKEGSLLKINPANGKVFHELPLGLHPNAIIADSHGKNLYICNSSSDYISVIDTRKFKMQETIPVSIFGTDQYLQGSTPNGLCLSEDGKTLYVSNGHDNALAVVKLSEKTGTPSRVAGFIPTEAFPAGLAIGDQELIVANLEAQGPHVFDSKKKAASIHQQMASVSIIPLPGDQELDSLTQLSLINSQAAAAQSLSLSPRKNALPAPVPQRIGEPSLFKHVVYIIKENKTYDQVLGDLTKGRGDSSLTVYGINTTPNTHALALQYGWMDNYYASGKSSAEGHQWTDAAMVSDYVEKNVRAWFRSYPHRQEDALVYNKAGFIWNNALDHGKTVRIYGEACTTPVEKGKRWLDYYREYQSGKAPGWKNTSTIQRILPIIHPTYPDCDNLLWSDQQRADLFIQEWKEFESSGTLPNLLILSLPNDHSAGTSPEWPTPSAMVADNDLALGRIIETISHSPYWDSTAIFVTEDDSQGGWDHLSPSRTIGLVISPYSNGQLVTSQYNQTSMVRTIEQILGIPPMNLIDATAIPLFDCFGKTKTAWKFKSLPSNIPLDQMNKPMARLKGMERKYARQSKKEVFEEVDGGEDEKMNQILWYHFKGVQTYPGAEIQH